MGMVDLVIPAYNGGATIEACLDSVSRQVIPEGWRLQTTVVDDASTDDTSQVVADYGQLEVRILTNGQNLGRARTCNVGAAHGLGEIVVFLDCDCELENQRVVTRFIRRIEEGDDCVFANVVASGDDFAARFTNETARKRFAAAQRGDFLAMTSAGFAIRRTVLADAGGFCEQYERYGFEDRDFIALLQRKGARLAVDEDCQVRHSEDFDAHDVARKFFESSKYSAPVFLRRFPEEYARSFYGKIDPACRRFPPDWAFRSLAACLPWTESAAARTLPSRWVPFSAKKLILRLTTFLAYVRGSLARPPG